jgi:hypothetical protein
MWLWTGDEMSLCGCAQGADGQLLDVLEITWYNDADDENAMQGHSYTTIVKRSSSAPSAESTTRMFVCLFKAWLTEEDK